MLRNRTFLVSLGKRFVQEGRLVLASSEGFGNLEELAKPFATIKPERLRLPYGDAGFSARVLPVHLDPSTDQASRRLSTILEHVKWMVQQTPWGGARRVFHPLCGPGLYAYALLQRKVPGYLGVDIGPATISYARNLCRWPADYRFVRRDVSAFRLSQEEVFQAALLTYEAINAFPPAKLAGLLRLVRAALQPDGLLIAEVRLSNTGEQPVAPGRTWEWCEASGIFAEGPHLLLDEWGYLANGAIFGHRTAAIPVVPTSRSRIYYSFLWLYEEDYLRALFEHLGYTVLSAERPFGHLATDVVQAAQNTFFVLRANSQSS